MTATAVDLKAAWKKFGDGDPLSNEELTALIENVEKGIEYLRARDRDKSVLDSAYRDRDTLKNFQFHRNHRNRS